MVYPANMQGQPFYGVLYKQYESRQAAWQGTNELPGKIQKLGPFIVRSAGGVFDELN